MPGNASETSVVSLRAFQSLHDHYLDFCRKIRFFIKGGFTIKEEALALEIILELLDQREKELGDLREKALDESREAGLTTESMELIVGRYLMQHEDYKILQRLSRIRRDGGAQWEALKAVIQGAPVHAPVEE